MENCARIEHSDAQGKLCWPLVGEAVRKFVVQNGLEGADTIVGLPGDSLYVRYFPMRSNADSLTRSLSRCECQWKMGLLLFIVLVVVLELVIEGLEDEDRFAEDEDDYDIAAFTNNSIFRASRTLK